MRHNCVTFIDWACSQRAEFLSIWHKSKHLSYNYDRKTGKAVIYNLRSGKMGCGSVGKHTSMDVALGLAWADYKKESIPENSGYCGAMTAPIGSTIYLSKRELTMNKNPLTVIGYRKNEIVCKRFDDEKGIYTVPRIYNVFVKF